MVTRGRNSLRSRWRLCRLTDAASPLKSPDIQKETPANRLVFLFVRWLQSGYFHFLTQNEIQHNESGSESKKFPVQLRSLAAKEGIRAKQEISELESANTFEVPASKFEPQTHLS